LSIDCEEQPGKPSSLTTDNCQLTTLHFTVRDTGIGIAPDKQSSIFNAFEQADNSITRQYGGSGLGLAISSELVRMMGGRIWLESDVGRGSTFHFTASFGLPAERQRPALELPDLTGMQVLVVDDNSTNRQILKEVLTHWRMNPTVVDGGPAALAIVDKANAAGQPFALMLFDVNMPGMDGFTLAEQIKKDPGHQSTPILLLTSADRMGDAERCRNLGLAGHLVKPVKQSSLLDSILAALGRRPLNGEPLRISPKDAPRRAPRSLQILLAEDNDVNQIMAGNLLEKWGHRVVIANNGKEVLAALEKQRFDAILMDVQMPELDGFKATAAIRANESATGTHIPIIAMTAHAIRGDRERCLEAGMDGYVAKPIRSEELWSVLSNISGPTIPPNGASKGEKPAEEVLDRAALLDYVEGDQALLRKIVKRFLENGPKLLARVEEAVARKDGPGLEQSAHQLKGAVGNFFAQSAWNAASRLETIGHEGDLTDSAAALTDLALALERLQVELAPLGKEETR
jgi:CheY-like chemotaxis protein